MIETLLFHRRHAARYRRIAGVMIAHGLGGLVAPYNLTTRVRWLVRLMRRRPHEVLEPTSSDELWSAHLPGGGARRAVHLRRALEELGPTFIKLGQVLSTRADLLPPLYIAELARLQDRVEADSFTAIRAVVEAELGAPLTDHFRTFAPEPLAAASIGQVHAAILRDGTEVVVKVQRPGVEATIEEDLAILMEIARTAERRFAIARQAEASAVVREFAWTIQAELDYMREGRNAERIGAAFERDHMIRTPAVCWTHTTKRLLTLERLHGIRIDDGDAIRAAGHDPAVIVRAGLIAFVRQVLDVGVFHADPHPGNFLVLADGTLGLLDYGMVGSIDERLRERLMLLALACVERDAARIVDELSMMGAVPALWDRLAVERDVDHLLIRYTGVSLAEIRLRDVVTDAMDMVRRHGLRLPAELALLIKTLLMAESLGRRLDPDLNIIMVVEPTIREAMRTFYSPAYWWEKLRLRPLEVALLAAALPGHVQRLLTRLERNDLAFHVHYDELPETLHGLNSMVNRLALSVMAAAGAIGFSVLFFAVSPVWGSWQAWLFVVLFAVLALMTANVLFRIWRSGR